MTTEATCHTLYLSEGMVCSQANVLDTWRHNTVVTTGRDSFQYHLFLISLTFYLQQQSPKIPIFPWISQWKVMTATFLCQADLTEWNGPYDLILSPTSNLLTFQIYRLMFFRQCSACMLWLWRISITISLSLSYAYNICQEACRSLSCCLYFYLSPVQSVYVRFSQTSTFIQIHDIK